MPIVWLNVEGERPQWDRPPPPPATCARTHPTPPYVPNTDTHTRAANLLSSWADVASMAVLSPNLACLRMGQNRLRPITSGLEVTDLPTHELLTKGFAGLQVRLWMRASVTIQ